MQRIVIFFMSAYSASAQRRLHRAFLQLRNVQAISLYDFSLGYRYFRADLSQAHGNELVRPGKMETNRHRPVAKARCFSAIRLSVASPRVERHTLMPSSRFVELTIGRRDPGIQRPCLLESSSATNSNNRFHPIKLI